MGYRRDPRRGDYWSDNCLVILCLAIIAMPIAGLYLLVKQDGDAGTKIIGAVLLILGIIIWVTAFAHS